MLSLIIGAMNVPTDRAIHPGQQARSTPVVTVSHPARRPLPQTRLGALLNPDPRRLLHAVSIVLLLLWCVWWGLSLAHHELIGVRRIWFRGFFGVDFLRCIDQPTRVWLAGGDPYAVYDVNMKPLFVYPPPVLRMFAWCGWFTPRQALAIWVASLGLMATAGAWASWRARKRLGLGDVPLSAVLVAVLFSTPVVYAMERGNYDLVTVPLVIVGLALMRTETRWAHVAAGAALSLAPWAKLYPGVLAVGLIALRCWTSFAGFLLGVILIGASSLDELQRFLVNQDQTVVPWVKLSQAFPKMPVYPAAHSLSANWWRLWVHTPVAWLGRLDGRLAAIAILGPLLCWVSYHLFRCPQRDRLAYPYLMWILALATFVPPIANDYSLGFLPLAALVVSDRRDPFLVKLAMAALCLWWQPLSLPINGSVLLVIKLTGLAAVGVSLTERCCELRPARLAPIGAQVVH